MNYMTKDLPKKFPGIFQIAVHSFTGLLKLTNSIKAKCCQYEVNILILI